MQFEESFYDYVKDYFGEYFSSIENTLRAHNLEYEGYNKSLSKILKSNDKLAKIYDGESVDMLSKDDCNELVEVFNCMRGIHLMQIELAFLAGFREAFLCFERTDLFVK